jgi:hypothetical protein
MEVADWKFLQAVADFLLFIARAGRLLRQIGRILLKA